MKIALLSTYPPARCGIGTYSSYLFSGLKKIKNDQVYVLTEKSNPPVKTKYLSVIPCYDKGEDYVENFIQKIREINPDVVHIQHEFGLYGWDNRLLRLLYSLRSSGFPLLITLHTIYAEGHTIKAPLGKSIEKYYLSISRLVDRVIAHQKECKTVLVRMGVNPDKISVISHGTTINRVKKGTDLRKRLGLKANAKIIMYFGFFKDVKLSLALIEALTLIFEKIPNSYFYIVGSFRIKSRRDLKHMKKVKSIIKKFNIQSRVIMINKFVKEEEVPLYFAASDVVVYPYDIPYWGDTGSAHRAIGAGAILAVSRIAKFDEIRNEIHEEIAVLPHHRKEWARLIIRLLTDNKFRRYIAKKTGLYAKKTSWDNIAKQHYALYKEVINS